MAKLVLLPLLKNKNKLQWRKMRLFSHPMNFAQSLKAYRKTHKITQTQLATIIPACPVRTVERWESGNPPPAWIQGLILSQLANEREMPPPLSRHARNRIAAKVAAKIASNPKMQEKLIEMSAKMANGENGKIN